MKFLASWAEGQSFYHRPSFYHPGSNLVVPRIVWVG